MTTTTQQIEEQQERKYYEVQYYGTSAIRTCDAADIGEELADVHYVEPSGGWLESDEFRLRPCNPEADATTQLIIVDNAGGIRVKIDRTDYYIGDAPFVRSYCDLEDITEWIGECDPYPSQEWDDDAVIAEWSRTHGWVLTRRSVDDYAGHTERQVAAGLLAAGAEVAP